MPLVQQTKDAVGDRTQWVAAARSKRHMSPKTSMARYVACLIILSTACACARTPSVHSPIPNSVKETSVMTTPASTHHPHQNTPPVPPKLNAEQVLQRLLELIRGSKSAQDFTPERLSKVMGVPIEFARDGSAEYGFGELLTPQWSYGFGVKKTPERGMRFEFSFNETSPGSSLPMTDICHIDFDRFTAELEAMGFTRQSYYGEHGRFIKDYFDRPEMRVEVYPEGEADEPLEKVNHKCVKTILI